MCSLVLFILGVTLIGCGAESTTLQNVIVIDRLADTGEVQNVLIVRDGKQLGTELGMKLTTNDEIKTDEKATAVISFGAGKTELIVGPDSRVSIQGNSVRAIIGNLFVKAKGGFKVETEYVTVAPEGTMFDVEVAGDQVVIGAFEGAVRLEPKLTKEEAVVLKRTEEGVVRKAAPTIKRTMAPEKIKRVTDRIAKIEALTTGAGGADRVPSFDDLCKELQRLDERGCEQVMGVFGIDAQTLARFQFDGDVLDDSGSEKHLRLLGGKFVKTPIGRGLHVFDSDELGLDWSDHAEQLVHPFTIEMILTPQSSAPWGKLFSFDDTNDNGWYYKQEGIQAYPHAVLGTGRVKGKQRHYLAFVSTGRRSIDVYFQGERLGSTETSFDSPPTQVIFFRDDSATGRSEQIDAVVEEMRISGIARTLKEIANVEEQLSARYPVSAEAK